MGYTNRSIADMDCSKGCGAGWCSVVVTTKVVKEMNDDRICE